MRRRTAAWVLVLAACALAGCGQQRDSGPARTLNSAAPTMTTTGSPQPTQNPVPPGPCGSSTPPPRQASVVSLGNDGAVRWDRALSTPGDLDSQALPIVAGDRVYVAVAGQVQALAADDGRVLWAVDAPGTAYGLWLTGSRLVVSLSQVGPDGRILALDSGTGRQLWRYPMPGRGLLGDQLLVGDGLAMVDARGATQLLDLATGRLRWQAPSRAQTYGLGVAGTVVLRAVGERLIGYSVTTGRELWRLPGLPDPAVIHGSSSIAIVEAGAIGPAISGDVTGVDPATGRRLWRTHEQDALGWGGGGPAGQVLYRTSSGTPEMLFVDTRTGRERWRARTQIALFLPAAVTGSTVTTIEGNTSVQRTTRLVVRDAMSGRVLGSADVSGATHAPTPLSSTTAAVLMFAQSPPEPATVTVAAYAPDGAAAWRSDLPRSTRGLVPTGDGGAVALTVDPAYGCAG